MPSARKRSGAAPAVVDWLLEPEQPAVRYRTLTELLGRPAADPEVRAARSAIPNVGFVPTLMEGRRKDGGWSADRTLYVPKYLSTNWRMNVLADLGVDRSWPVIAKSSELWMARYPLAGGGVGGNSKGTGHHCLVGSMTRSLIRLGYGDDPRIRRSLDWLVETADPKGGWSCFGRGRNLDSWEGLSAFAAYPRDRWTAPMQRTVERASEFFLERELHRQGAEYPPWFRFHYPVHYYYDLLIGLNLLTSLGYADDRRLRFARDHLLAKRRPDGRWLLDAQHPDVEGGMAAWLARHPKDRPTPLELEAAGAPSKLVTLTALKVLARLGA